MDVVDAFNEFDRRLRTHLPSTEAGVREVLAQSIREAMGSSPGDVEVEASFGTKRHDIMIHPTRTAIEVKFHREIPGGSSRPLTVQYGQLLADVRKLASNTALDRRVLLLLTDRPGLTHLKNKALLPGGWGTRMISSRRVTGLARSAYGPATADGPWIDASVRLMWQTTHPGDLHGLAWTVEAVSPA